MNGTAPSTHLETDVLVPVGSVLGIYARENGQGMVFERDDSPPDAPGPDNPTPPDRPGKRPSLKVVK